MKTYVFRVRRWKGSPITPTITAREIKEVARNIRRRYPSHQGFEIKETYLE